MKVRARRKVHVITMGCAKNVVDSEKLMAQLGGNNIEVTPTIENADIAIVNTCGFIDAAKEESLDALFETLQRKAGGSLKKVYAVGCLTQRYGDDLVREIPELDGVFGTDSASALLHALGAEYKHELLGERRLTTPSHFAYLKISEGCDRPCSFCAIPLMRGRHVSRPIEQIVAEADQLASRGVKEFVVIGQDTTAYGVDLYGRSRLADLLARLGDLNGIRWVRLMYAYPAGFPREVLEVLSEHPRLCKYVDIPVQHVSDTVLRSMRRGTSGGALRALLDSVRSRVAGVGIRTTLIVGYPSEGIREFEELLEFIRITEFDRLGVFTYSREENTRAFPLGDPVPSREKERRKALVMELQQEISERKNQALVGARREVLLDRIEQGLYVGRTEHDAPEIDNEVFVHAESSLSTGTFCDVDIVGAYEYDLVGKCAQRES